MRNFRIALLGAVGWLAVYGPASAQTQPAPDMPFTSTFGRWTTMVDTLDTGQDAHKTCAASTAFYDASGNSGTLTLSISTGDALPPDAYPAIMLTVDNKQLPTGEKIAATFGDPGVKVSATGFMNVTRPSGSVAITASPMLVRVVENLCSLSLRRTSMTCLWRAISIVTRNSLSANGFSR